MTARNILLLGGATAVLWVVPSIGTQGMGTIGASVAHPDATLFDSVPARRAEARAMLSQADDGVEAAIGL
jgi:hypothetical protein